MPNGSLPPELLARFREGLAIPAMPLALTADRTLDQRRQRAVIRYYIDSGAGGIAVGVHSTQFEIRLPQHGLFEPVLQLASKTIDSWPPRQGRPVLKIAGVAGPTSQAVREAEFADGTGYHAALVSLVALGDASDDELLEHCRKVARVMPVIGFYLQSAVGGRPLSRAFWRNFCGIENVIGIKIAPFNRYQTLDVVRAVCEAGREREIALYTGNDDNIVVDLLTEFRITDLSPTRSVRIVGGLLGQWGVWTSTAVALLKRIHQITASGNPIPSDLLSEAIAFTDANAAIFDASNRFRGVIPGVHEILRRQGLLAGIWCLDPALGLSNGQREEIDRVCSAYPHLTDDRFVRENLSRWLED
ncbi:MAG TPA: dihydrodipicolinate synthase family protein [Spirochaetia bacterium]|nr:dihydrodipicolinate synthase family protein [Spirochaetia bacterium]